MRDYHETIRAVIGIGIAALVILGLYALIEGLS